jgi:hypothetical protein
MFAFSVARFLGALLRRTMIEDGWHQTWVGACVGHSVVEYSSGFSIVFGGTVLWTLFEVTKRIIDVALLRVDYPL